MSAKPSNTTNEDAEATPVFNESIGGALIDAARISVMGALHILPPPPAYARIVLPGDEEPPGTVQECLVQAAQWLDAARALTIEQSGAAPTSLHDPAMASGGRP